MLSRRNLRIKVMQTVYAYDAKAYANSGYAEKILLKSIENGVREYIYSLFLLQRITGYVYTAAEKRASKHLPTKEDLNVSTVIGENRLIKSLEADEEFQKKVRQYKIDKYDLQDIPRQLFKKFSETDEYLAYSGLDAPDATQDMQIIKFLFKKVMMKDELFIQHMEENFWNWPDDKSFVAFGVINSIEDFEKRNQFFSPEYSDLDESNSFSKDLLWKTLDNEDEFVKLIEPKLVNWEVERIAILDLILMKMALSELLYFPYIPIKVSINEYIEISKLYSTPKSKEFINGVLDKLAKELKEANKINKSGRGLVE